MSKAAIENEIKLLKNALAPELEPKWKEKVAEIIKALVEFEKIKEETGFYDLPEAEQDKIVDIVMKQVIHQYFPEAQL